MIGIYAFFHIDFDTGKLLLTVGKTIDDEDRVGRYKVTNANISFHYFKKVPSNQLKKAETKLIDILKVAGYKLWKNSREQFIVDDEKITRQFLSEQMECLDTVRNSKIDFNYATLDGEVKDLRNDRPKSDFIPGELAMTISKAGLKERYRKVKTRYVHNGTKLIQFDTLKSKLIDKKAWMIWQCAFKTATFKQEKGPF
jgi:hypothetical protein